MYYTTNISGQTKKTNKKGKCFIPPFYECDINVLGKDNIKIVNTNEGINVYVTPLIRTLLSDIKNYDVKGNESLGRYIKEKMDSNSRLLIKKSMERSQISYIQGRQFLLLNCRISQINPNKFRIYNDR